MNNKELDQDLKNPIPAADDERFWDDFSRELWFVFKQSEDFEGIEAENQMFANLAESVETSKPEMRINLRENCLTFPRCAEIGQKHTEISANEKLHLQDCRFCARRIEKFGKMPRLDSAENIAGESLPKNSWWSGVISQADNIFYQISGKLVFASLGTIAILGTVFFIFLFNFDKSEQEKVSISDPSQKVQLTENSNLTANEMSETNSNNRNSINSPVSNPKNIPDKTKQITPSPTSENEAVMLAFLSTDEREAVRESLQVGRIRISKDLALLKENPILRGNEKITVPQISPKDEATPENRPVFRWESLENYEYKIIVLDQGLKKVAESGILMQNNWQIEKPITADFYFWKVLVRKKGAADFDQTENKAFFKIVGKAEKVQIEKAKQATGSNLVSAILYARAGLFAEAERDLNAEIKKNPKSVKAQKMLTQVRQWKMK